jgi:hypothetical protein
MKNKGEFAVVDKINSLIAFKQQNTRKRLRNEVKPIQK